MIETRQPAPLPDVIRVDRDGEGLRLAVFALFEEALLLQRAQPTIKNADAETVARLLDDMPERPVGEGYFRRAAYLIDLSTTLDLGIPLDHACFTHADVVGLGAVRAARAEYEKVHPQCGGCGERQDNRWGKQCFSCGSKFAGRGAN